MTIAVELHRAASSVNPYASAARLPRRGGLLLRRKEEGRKLIVVFRSRDGMRLRARRFGQIW